jgi:N-acetylmuramoyl-L-alanine amidase
LGCRHRTKEGESVTKPILIIDPGHGGKDPGGGSNEHWLEKDMALKISLYQRDRFKDLGIPVAMTRETDIYLSPAIRCQLVINSGAPYCISNHINAGGGDGAETIHSIYADDVLAAQLAEEIRKEGQNIRRVFTRTLPYNRKKDYYFMHRDTGAVNTTIVEYGFADSKKDDVQQILDHWMIYAEAVVRGFCNHIGRPYYPPDKGWEKGENELDIIHTRTRWTSWTGVELVPLNYSAHKAEDGWTDIRYCVIPEGYEMDLIVNHYKTVPEIAQGYDLAINGPFFYNGKPIGYVVRDGKLISDTVKAEKWADFIVYEDGRMEIGQLDKTQLEGIKLAFTSTCRIVRDGKISIESWVEGTPKDVVTGNRPRTAIGIREDGKLIISVVDGDSKWDAGLRIDELAAVMIKLGAKQALNLDGGGSSVMVHQGKAITPNKGTRKTGSAIVFKHHCS